MASDTLNIATPSRSRRALLTAALGGLGGLFASRLGAPGTAAAAAGDPLIIGNTTNTAGTANTSLTTASNGTALHVTQNGAGTALRGSAVGAGSIAGFFTAANGTGISGVTANSTTYGVFGQNNAAIGGGGGAIRAAGGANHGVVATTAGPAPSNAIRAITTSAADNVAAIYAEVSSFAPGAGSAAVRGVSNGTSTNGIGVWGSQAGAGTGVYGSSNSWYSGYFDGSVYAISLDAGSVSASIKSFRIDHPLDPAGKVLTHSCVESNERKLVYDGVVTTDARGEATVELPGYFEALNGDVRYQLTPLADARAWVKRKVAGNRFTIATSEPSTEVCWQVSGVRQDAYSKAHPLVVESVKTGREKGRYLNPVEHGQPERLGVDYELRQKAHAAAAD